MTKGDGVDIGGFEATNIFEQWKILEIGLQKNHVYLFARYSADPVSVPFGGQIRANYKNSTVLFTQWTLSGPGPFSKLFGLNTSSDLNLIQTLSI